MSLKDIIEQGSSFKIDAENDFNNDPSWINDSNLDKYQQWEHCTSMYLKDKYPNNETYIKFSELTGNNRIDILDKQLNLLKALLSYTNEESSQDSDNNVIIESVFNNFNDFITQTSKRYDNRNSFFIINDEYDVQDILHSIFKLFYKDIEKEFVIPKFAGSSTRIDFVLNNRQIGIEVK